MGARVACQHMHAQHATCLGSRDAGLRTPCTQARHTDTPPSDAPPSDALTVDEHLGSGTQQHGEQHCHQPRRRSPVTPSSEAPIIPGQRGSVPHFCAISWRGEPEMPLGVGAIGSGPPPGCHACTQTTTACRQVDPVGATVHAATPHELASVHWPLCAWLQPPVQTLAQCRPHPLQTARRPPPHPPLPCPVPANFVKMCDLLRQPRPRAARDREGRRQRGGPPSQW